MVRGETTETDWMLLESGTSTNMTSLKGKVKNCSPCSVPISLADGCTVTKTVNGKGSVICKYDNKATDIGLYKTLVSN